MPRHAKWGNFATLLVVSVLALMIIPWGTAIAQNQTGKSSDDESLRRPHKRQLTPQQQFNMREYGMTFSQDDYAELDRVTDELLREERERGHWGGPYQEYMLYNKIKHLSAASKEARPLQNLVMGLPRKSRLDPIQLKVERNSIYSYILPSALTNTDKYMQEWADQIDPEYRKVSDKKYDLIMTALPTKDTALAKLAVAELHWAVKTLEGKLKLDEGEEGGCETECKKPEHTDSVEIAQVKDELEAQEAAMQEIESTVEQIRAIRNVWNAIFDYRLTLIGELAQKETTGGFTLSIRSDLLKLHGANDEVVAIISDFTRVLDKVRRKELTVADLLPRTAAVLENLAAERRRLVAWFNEEITKQNQDGYTWLARALIYDNTSFVDFLVSWNAPGTLKQQLLTSCAANSPQRVNRLMDIGADVSQEPGAWSPLAYAMVYGAPYGFSNGKILQQAGGSIQVPWDPTASSGDKLARIDNQLDRVARFVNSIGADSKSDKGLAYTQKFLDYLRCRIDCIKRTKRMQSSMAQNH